MKSDTINALELLESQHLEVDQLIEQIEKSDEPDEKARLFRQVADNLAAHATIEEKVFYPAINAKQTHETLVEAVEEHLQIKRLLADMMELDVEDERFDGKLSVLKEELKHHAHEEEEDELFPKVKKLFGDDDLAALGNELLVMFEDLMQHEPRTSIPSETAAAAPVA